ncbi:hypothetical protein OK348_02240 [Flavobacterium sp. MXW15]|uniref:Uncharacterized protein n=1 Tax=Xanthomonas chitinilytica TaxID=2989819 RepID=A0ABT3JU66_9XANT|nr:hypothetical protein [Xanthomonas sp. H13-6]MCW4453615.1 hypothetical protein [Flavobacterium sp. MXW15]MCW4472032.1 hypothetical protein [Xanthomonas sp. H13-6]
MALIHAKTEAGRQEIEDRGRKLPPALRSILLMVDGQRDDEELGQLGQNLRAPDDALAQLAAMGLIEAVAGQASAAPKVMATAKIGNDPERYQQLYDWMTESVRKHLGLKGYFLQLKIERADTATGLEQLWPDVANALSKSKSHAFATRWLEETRALVST